MKCPVSDGLLRQGRPHFVALLQLSMSSFALTGRRLLEVGSSLTRRENTLLESFKSEVEARAEHPGHEKLQ